MKVESKQLKISELISQLQENLATYGDIPIVAEVVTTAWPGVMHRFIDTQSRLLETKELVLMVRKQPKKWD